MIARSEVRQTSENYMNCCAMRPNTNEKRKKFNKRKNIALMKIYLLLLSHIFYTILHNNLSLQRWTLALEKEWCIEREREKSALAGQRRKATKKAARSFAVVFVSAPRPFFCTVCSMLILYRCILFQWHGLLFYLYFST